MPDRKSYIDENGDALELDVAWFAQAKRGRPALAPQDRKRRVNLTLDPDVVEGLKARGAMSTEANTLLREALGL